MTKLRNRIRDRGGFSLVELMIVLVIIGILAGIGIPRYRTATTRAKVSEFKMILQQIHALEENYYAEYDTYTSDLDALGFDDPKARYFTFSVESDSTTFTVIATCTANLKGKGGASLKGMTATLNNEEEHGGDMSLRKIARW